MERRWRALSIVLLAALAAPGAVALETADEVFVQSDSPCGESVLSAGTMIQICDHGGEGASSCETRWTINVSGWGSVSSCGVSCDTGHYACCQDPSITKRAECTCVPERVRVPATPLPPESPGL